MQMAFAEIGIELSFIGEGVEEKAVISKCTHPDYQLPIGKEVVGIDPRYFRPTEVELLIGDPTKANTQLGWKPKYDLAMLVKEMVEADLDNFKRDQILEREGHRTLNYFE
ncbi:MAG: GDP-mannose 4,6-dehydratase [Spirosomataceae bacterium]